MKCGKIFTTGNGEILYKSTNSGFSFGSAINLSNNGGNSDDAAVAASGNSVYVVWHDNTPGNAEVLQEIHHLRSYL